MSTPFEPPALMLFSKEQLFKLQLPPDILMAPPFGVLSAPHPVVPEQLLEKVQLVNEEVPPLIK